MKGAIEPESASDNNVNAVTRRPRRSAAITAADRLAATAKAESAGPSENVGSLKRKTKQKRDSDASDSLDSDFGSSAAEDVESDEVSSSGISEAEEHEAAVVTKAAAPGHQAKRRSGSSGSRKPTAQKPPGQQQHQKRPRQTPTQLVSGSHWIQQMAPGEDQSAAAAAAPAADVPGQADWDLQLALQMSLQDSPDSQAGSGVAELPGVNIIMNRAVNLNDDQQQQLNQQEQQHSASKQYHSIQQPAATTQTAQQHDDITTRQQSAPTSEVQGPGKSSSGVKSKRGSKKKARTAASPGWTAADLFDLFAMFEPAGGVVTKQHIVKQMLKAGLEADDNLLDNMMQYAKQLVEQQAQLLGRAVTGGSNSNSNSLEYEEFALLGQYIDATR